MPDSKKNNSIEFKTGTDKNIFFKVLTRSIYPISHEVFNVEKIVSDDIECEFCGENKADYRIVKNRSNTFSLNYCYPCIKEQTQEWLDEQLQQLKENLDRVQVAEEL